jgi:hypothetical protein
MVRVESSAIRHETKTIGEFNSGDDFVFDPIDDFHLLVEVDTDDSWHGVGSVGLVA